MNCYSTVPSISSLQYCTLESASRWHILYGHLLIEQARSWRHERQNVWSCNWVFRLTQKCVGRSSGENWCYRSDKTQNDVGRLIATIQWSLNEIVRTTAVIGKRLCNKCTFEWLHFFGNIGSNFCGSIVGIFACFAWAKFDYNFSFPNYFPASKFRILERVCLNCNAPKVAVNSRRSQKLSCPKVGLNGQVVFGQRQRRRQQRTTTKFWSLLLSGNWSWKDNLFCWKRQKLGSDDPHCLSLLSSSELTHQQLKIMGTAICYLIINL